MECDEYNPHKKFYILTPNLELRLSIFLLILKPDDFPRIFFQDNKNVLQMILSKQNQKPIFVPWIQNGKKLLNENTIRRFMKLAEIDTLSDQFVGSLRSPLESAAGSRCVADLSTSWIVCSAERAAAVDASGRR